VFLILWLSSRLADSGRHRLTPYYANFTNQPNPQPSHTITKQTTTNNNPLQAFSVNLMYTYALQMGNYMFLIQVGAFACHRL